VERCGSFQTSLRGLTFSPARRHHLSECGGTPPPFTHDHNLPVQGGAKLLLYPPFETKEMGGQKSSCFSANC
jgi:hypothetical protein